MNNFNNIDVIVKSFNRPECLLRLVRSWNKKYPNIMLTICDDSTIPMDFSDDAYRKHNIIILPKPDVGISYGRNFGVHHTSKEYILFLDDDFVIGEGMQLDVFVKLIELRNDIALVGGVMGKRDVNAVIQGGRLYIDNDICFKQCLGDQFNNYQGCRYRECDITDNFFLARRIIFDEVCWDNKLKIAEHTDFFLQIKGTRWKVLFTPDVSVEHIHQENNMYSSYRYDRHFRYKELFWGKYNIRKECYIDEEGKLQKVWLTSQARVDFDKKGNILPISSKLRGFVLVESVKRQQNTMFVIVAKDRLDLLHKIGGYLDPATVLEAKPVYLNRIGDNAELFLVKI